MSNDTAPLEAVFDEVRQLWNRLVEVGEALHAREPVTLGMRAVLEALLAKGPSSVPALARARHVTRQHIQTLANALLEQGLVQAGGNPAHRRSPLLALTTSGQTLIRRMKAREAERLRPLGRRFPASDLQRTAALLRALREAL
jgi:DNA-binding MarR family transcriptional regulator